MIKFVSSDDWDVIYGDAGDKIWEGHYTNSNVVIAIAKYFGEKVNFYDFTDEDEIDGETPDNFNDIIGIK